MYYVIEDIIKNIKDRFCKHKNFDIIRIPNTQSEIRYCKDCNKLSLKHIGIGCQTNAYKYDTFVRNLSPDQRLALDNYLNSIKEDNTNDNSNKNQEY